MATSVTERWSASRKGLTDPWQAHREFDVTGATSQDDALNASGVPQLNDALSAGSSLRCRGPVVNSHPSLQHWIISCDYGIPKAGSFSQQETDPLNQPVRISYEIVETSLPVDRDMANIPLLYSNGKPIPGVTNIFQWLRLSFLKNYDHYDLNWFNTWSNAVNTDQVSIGGITFAVQHLKCCSVVPAVEYEANANYIPVRWTFEAIPYNLLGTYPFQYRFMDQGESGWWSDSGTKREGKFTQGNIASPVVGTVAHWESVGTVRLDGTGKPLAAAHPNIKVSSGQTPTTPPVAVTINTYESTSDAYWLLYRKTKLAAFNGIPL